MADTKISGLTAAASGSPASGDLFVGVDISDTTMAATGTDKRWTFAQLSNQFNVKAYGAAGDGTTNDTTAIGLAFTAGTGGVVVFPSGTYMADNLSIPAGTTVWLLPGTTIKKRANGNLLSTSGAAVTITGTGTIDNNSAASFTGHGIVTTNNNVTIDGPNVINTLATYNSIQVASSTNTTARNCFTDSHIIAFNTQQVKITDNWCGGEVSVNWTTGSDMYGVWVERNLVTTAVAGSNECIVIHTQGTGLVHIHDVHCNYNMAVSAIATSPIGISLPGLQDFECNGNYCDVTGSGTMTLGYELATCTGGTVQANAVHNATTGMIAHDSFNLVIADNVVTLPATASATAYKTLSDSSRGAKNISWHHNVSVHPAGVTTYAFWVESNNAAATVNGVYYDGNVIDGTSALNETTAFAQHVNSGTISNVEYTNNRMKNCDVLFEFGAVAGVKITDNTYVGSGRNLIWQSGSAPTGICIMENNTFNWVTGGTPPTTYAFKGSKVWRSDPAGSGVPGWVNVAAAGTPTYKTMAVLGA